MRKSRHFRETCFNVSKRDRPWSELRSVDLRSRRRQCWGWPQLCRERCSCVEVHFTFLSQTLLLVISWLRLKCDTFAHRSQIRKSPFKICALSDGRCPRYSRSQKSCFKFVRFPRGRPRGV